MAHVEAHPSQTIENTEPVEYEIDENEGFSAQGKKFTREWFRKFQIFEDFCRDGKNRRT